MELLKLSTLLSHMLDQFFLADGSAAVEQQIFQNAALLARERKRLSVCRGRAAAGIKRQPAAPQAPSCWTNRRRVRLRTRASSSSKWNGLDR